MHRPRGHRLLPAGEGGPAEEVGPAGQGAKDAAVPCGGPVDEYEVPHRGELPGARVVGALFQPPVALPVLTDEGAALPVDGGDAGRDALGVLRQKVRREAVVV